MSLGDQLKKQGLKKLPKQRKPNPLPLRPDILLHPNIVKPLHGVNPRTILGSSWWNKERQSAYASTEYHCLACGVHKTEAKSRQWLEAHELYEIDYCKGIARYVEAVPLCNPCHMYIHDGRMTHLLEKGLLPHAKFVMVITHGDRVLRRAGLSRPTHQEREAQIMALNSAGKLAEWSSWRLVIGKKKYPPLYKTYEEWKEAMEVAD